MKHVTNEEFQTFREQIAKRLESIREEQQMTQQDLSEELGVSQNLIFRSENGLKLSMPALFAIYIYYRKKYKLNPAWLFEIDNEDVPRYFTVQALKTRKQEGNDQKRNKIIREMMEKLQDDNLLDD